MEAALERLSEAVRAAAEQRSPLAPRGGGTKAFYGRPVQAAPLDVRGYAGIVEYEPSELVVTARCGTPLAELEAVLAEAGQMLAFEPPHFGAGATVGGMVAAGLSGPRRVAAGPLRDFVLGVKLLDAKGEVLAFGGRVMKNVAGYDVSRLVAGSLGTLGVILEVSLKVLPRPVAEATLRFELPQDRAIEQLNRWAGRPLPVSASAWSDGELHVRLSGAEAALRAAEEAMGGERLEEGEAARLWEDVREQRLEFFRGSAESPSALWRVAMPSTTPPLAVPGEQLIEWGGGLRWIVTAAEPAVVREAAARAGGHATLFRASDEEKLSAGVFQPLAAWLAELHRRLKRELDPLGIFNPGRMYPEW